LRDIAPFTGQLKDINKFISSCKAANDFIPAARDAERPRFLNGIKNKLDSATFNAIGDTVFNTIDAFCTAVENIFLISTNPETVQMKLIQRTQKPDETVLQFANAFLELHHEYIMLYKLKFPAANHDEVKTANEALLKHNFLSNLREPLKRYARGHFFETFIAAKKWAIDMETSSKPPQDPNVKELTKSFVKSNFMRQPNPQNHLFLQRNRIAYPRSRKNKHTTAILLKRS
jgi:hypothetical protein